MKTLIFTSSAFQYSCFISGNDIEHSLSESAKLAEKKRKEQVEKNRKVISTLCNITTFLARQNLAFRGHDESEDSDNKGNYLELIQLISVFDRNLALHLKENEKYCRYTSPAIQNEIIGTLAQITRDDIINEIKEAGIFSMMLDETSDMSKDEQLSFVFRYALWGEIFETFLTFKNIASTTGEILFGTVNITLKEFELEIKNLRGLGTDGAANMTGKYQGLKTRILEVNPIVKSVRCACHALNLVLVQACQSSIPMKVFFATLGELYVFIEGSPKRHNTFFDIQKELNLKPRSLKRHAETRWETHHEVIEDTIATYPAIFRMLEDMITNETDTTVVSKANGLFLSCEKFEFIAMLAIFDKVLQLTNILSKTLQNDNVDLAECFQLVDCCITNLNELRKEQEFEKFIDEASKVAIECGVSDEFTEKRLRKKKRFFDELASDEVAENAKEQFKRDVYFTAIDVIITQLNERFDQSRRILSAFTCLSPDNLLNRSKEDNESSLNVLLEEYGSAGSADVSTNDAIAEYTLFQTRFKERKGIKVATKKRVQVLKKTRTVYKWETEESDCTSPKHIFKFLFSSNLYKVFPNLYRLYQIFLTIPVTTAGPERTFSKLKLIKTCQRSTMNQKRTSDLAVLSTERSRSLNVDRAVDLFGSVKSRRKNLFV